MKTIFDKKAPIEQRVNFLEIITGRLARRVHKVTSAVIPPHIISTCKTGDVKGDILKAMLFAGTVTKGLICFDKRPKNPICIEVKLLNDKIGFTKSYYIDRIREKVDLDIKTIDGSMVTVSVHPANEEEVINEVWLSFLWTPDISKVQVENYLIENLEKAADANLIEE